MASETRTTQYDVNAKIQAMMEASPEKLREDFKRLDTQFQASRQELGRCLQHLERFISIRRGPLRYRIRFRSGRWWGLLLFVLADQVFPFVSVVGLVVLVGLFVTPVGRWLGRQIPALWGEK